MKYCGSCKENKDESDFGKRAASKDGLAHKCRSCQKEYDKARLNDPGRMKARRDYQKTENGKLRHKLANKDWINRNQIKRAAHIMVSNAVRDGKLEKSDSCQKCGSTQRVEGHHDDYSRPLVVRWLCRDCHSQWHEKNGEGLNG